MQFFAVLRVVENYPCLEKFQIVEYSIQRVVEQIIYLFYQTEKNAHIVLDVP